MSNEQDSSISEIESWNQLQYHFFEHEGLLDQIEQGQGIKQEAVEEVKFALTTLHNAWEKQPTIPRRQVLLLWSALLRLDRVLTNNAQDDQEELLTLIGRLKGWLEMVFNDPSSSMGEERAMEVLLQHLVGGPSFGLQLRQGYVNASFFHNLVLQIEKLKRSWEGKEEISRRACGALFAIERLPWSSRAASETKMQELARMKQELYTQINVCLHGDRIEKKKEQE